jgi:type II secretory pathway predicted ATPase ExeA
MYNNFFGFDKKPFAHNPNPDFLFLGKTHKAVLSSLKSGLLNQFGMMVVTGDIGTGKSILAHSLLNQLEQNYTAAILTNTQYKTVEEMLKNIFIAFGIIYRGKNLTELSTLFFENFLTTQFNNKKKVLLIIDEAQNLSVELLENIRLLSNFTINNEQTIQFILVGQKGLKDILQAPELKQLVQRISLFEELPPLNLKETHQYILHRLKTAGANKNESLFTQKACDSVYKFSGGIPSLINLICELSLVTAFAEEIKSIDSGIIETVANERKGGILQIKEHIPIYNDEQNEFLKQLHTFKETIKTQDKNEPDITHSSENKTRTSSTNLEKVINTIPSTDITNTKPLKKDAQSKLKSVDLSETPGRQLPEKTINTIDEDAEKSAKTYDKQKESRQIAYKKPNKWLIAAVASLFLVNITLYLYANKSSDKDKQIIQEPLSISQKTISSTPPQQQSKSSINIYSKEKSAQNDSHAGEINLAKYDGQLTNKMPSHTGISLSIKQNIELEIKKVSPATDTKAQSSPDKVITTPQPIDSKIQDTGHKDTTKIEGKTGLKPSSVIIDTQKESISADKTKNSDQNSDLLKVLPKKSNTESLVDNEPPTTVSPKTAEQQLKQTQEAKRLLYLAKSQFSKLYLTTPKHYNAVDTYKKILDLDPEFEQALLDLNIIKDIYIYWAERDIKRRRFKQAETFIKKALQAVPNDAQLLIMLDSIKQQTTTSN